MTGPLLDADDFARLLHGGACSHLARRHGIPPDIVTEPDPRGLRWVDFPFEDGLSDFANEARQFFDLGNRPVFELTETLADAGARLCAEWARTSGNVIFRTSGSTGVPEPHRHSSAMLCQETVALLPLFHDRKRFVCTTPLLHSYGFIFGFLLPKLSRKPSVILPSLPTFLAGTLRPGDLLISFPQLLGRIVVRPPDNVHCLTSTAPCPPGLFSALNERGFAATTEIYGSSETGAMAFRNEENAPFTLLPHWCKRDELSILRLAAEGEAESVRQLPDHVEWFGDRRLAPTGRIDRAVQIAGVNVYPEKIAARLREHPLIRDCAVRPMRPEEGSRLKAFVVPEGEMDIAAVRKTLREYIKTAFTTAERPARLTFGQALPRTGAGKFCDWE